MNEKGQALVEALIIGSFSLISLILIFTSGQKIIQTSLENEKNEETYICQNLIKSACTK